MITLIRVLSLLSAALCSHAQGETAEIRTVLREVNEALRGKNPSSSVRTLFTPNADYRDAVRSVKGAAAVAALFTPDHVWSERLRPVLEEDNIRLVGTAAALVDVHLVQYSSAMGKASAPAVLLFERDSSGWKISSWRMAGCGVTLTP